MSNPFYNATGNPASNSEGLSAVMRAEFSLIADGFDLVPQLLTTGAYVTTLAQIASITITLPAVDGTMATLTGTETFTNKTIVSPTLTGTPTTPTASPGTNTTQAASTAFTGAAVLVETMRAEAAEAAETARAEAAEALLAPLASPHLTGTPLAPTASPGTNTTQLATTAFDTAAIAVETTRAEAAEALLAPLASPTLTGTPTAPTAVSGTNTMQLATTAFVQAAASGSGSISAGRVVLGTVTMQFGQGLVTGGTLEITFGTAFSAAPTIVFLTPNQDPAPKLIYVTPTTMGFTITDDNGGTFHVSWMVIGPT